MSCENVSAPADLSKYSAQQQRVHAATADVAGISKSGFLYTKKSQNKSADNVHPQTPTKRATFDDNKNVRGDDTYSKKSNKSNAAASVDAASAAMAALTVTVTRLRRALLRASAVRAFATPIAALTVTRALGCGGLTSAAMTVVTATAEAARAYTAAATYDCEHEKDWDRSDMRRHCDAGYDPEAGLEAEELELELGAVGGVAYAHDTRRADRWLFLRYFDTEQQCHLESCISFNTL